MNDTVTRYVLMWSRGNDTYVGHYSDVVSLADARRYKTKAGAQRAAPRFGYRQSIGLARAVPVLDPNPEVS